jgi:AAA domain/Bifunctional DNA primase/polymerase, N-terminal
MHPRPYELARAYHARGLCVLPVEYRGKRPSHNHKMLSGWQSLRITADDLAIYFNGQPQNIGVLLGEASGGLVDVDLDCDAAVLLAPYFLPPTGATFGRDSKRRSHWLYFASIATKKFRDPLVEKQDATEGDKAMLVELRSTGAQTVFPGSTHQSGEAITWDDSGDPARSEARELESAAARLAAASLLARYWPRGSRNDAANALAGGLLRAGWPEDQTEHFIKAVCLAAQDEETPARVRNVVDTAAKLKDGAAVTGWPTLAGIIDSRAVDRVCEWLKIQKVAAKSKQDSISGDEVKAADDSPLRVVCMADIKPETVRWLWHPYIALGKLTLLEGDPGIGKSTLTCALASAVTNGRGFPGAEAFEPGNVLMLSAEDGLADTLRPRLDSVGADVSRVLALDEPLTLDTSGMLRLEAAIIEYRPKLAVIDPLFAYTGGKADIHRANECRAISAPLAAIAERQGCAIIAVRHLSKSRGGGHALNAGIGSIDFVAAARSVLLAGQDPNDPKKRAIVQTKSNLAPIGEAVGYTIEGGKFYWTGASTLTAGIILSLPSDEEERGTLAEAKEFLLAALSEGSRDNKVLKQEAKQAGISERTLFRAKQELNIKAEKVGVPGAKGQTWVWKLPAEGCQAPAEECQSSSVGSLRTSEYENSLYGNNLAGGCQD